MGNTKVKCVNGIFQGWENLSKCETKRNDVEIKLFKHLTKKHEDMQVLEQGYEKLTHIFTGVENLKDTQYYHCRVERENDPLSPYVSKTEHIDAKHDESKAKQDQNLLKK